MFPDKQTHLIVEVCQCNCVGWWPVNWDSGLGQAVGRAHLVTAATQKEKESLGVESRGGEHHSRRKVEKYSWKRIALLLWGSAWVSTSNYGRTCYKLHISCILERGVGILPVSLGVFFPSPALFFDWLIDYLSNTKTIMFLFSYNWFTDDLKGLFLMSTIFIIGNIFFFLNSKFLQPIFSFLSVSMLYVISCSASLLTSLHLLQKFVKFCLSSGWGLQSLPEMQLLEQWAKE